MARLILEFQPLNFVKSHNFCRQITEKSLVIISESVSDLEKSAGSAPSIYIDVLGLMDSKSFYSSAVHHGRMGYKKIRPFPLVFSPNCIILSILS